MSVEPESSGLPLVSVVIPTHRRPDLLRRALASVLSQDYAGAIDVIIVHDKEDLDLSLASTGELRRVRVIANSRTPGLPGARNSGVLVADGELIASLDDDDSWFDTKLSKQVAVLQKNPTALVTATGVVLHTPGGGEHRRVPANDRITHADLLLNRHPEVHSSNLVIRRRAYDLAGLYDETISWLIEDWDWLLRVSARSDIYIVREPLIHVFRDAALWRPERWRLGAEARHQLIDRHPELIATAKGASAYYSKLAFAHAAAGQRRQGARWLARSVRHGRVGRWTLMAGASLAHVPTRWLQAAAGRAGKSI
jgi:glycosyltransferase involved in cell wall biosynthesis